MTDKYTLALIKKNGDVIKDIITADIPEGLMIMIDASPYSRICSTVINAEANREWLKKFLEEYGETVTLYL